MNQSCTVLVLVLVSLLRCPAAAQRADTTDDRGAIMSVLTAQQEAWNTGDLEGYMAGYWKSDSLEFTSRGIIRRGWEKTLAGYRATYTTREQMGKLSFSGVSVTLLGPEAAMVVGTWELRRANDAPGGVFTLIMKKFSGGWYIIHDHTSARAAGPASN